MKKFQQIREVIIYAGKYISGKTLDLGAGRAKYRDIIKEKSSEYIAFDMRPGPNIDVVGNVLDLPFGDNTFDTIVSTQVLEHVEKPWIMVKEISRVLKKGGICILTAPFLIPHHSDPHDYFRYTTEGIKSLFENENFEIIECSSSGQLFSVFSEFVRFLWFNPYQKRRKGTWKITRFMAKAAKFFNKFTKNKIFYTNVYIIARK